MDPSTRATSDQTVSEQPQQPTAPPARTRTALTYISSTSALSGLPHRITSTYQKENLFSKI